MKKQLMLLLLALVGIACQPQDPPEAAMAHTVSPAVGATATPLLPTQPLLRDSLTPEMRRTLQRVKLASLFLAPEPNHIPESQPVLNGFFGKDPQRLSLAILQVVRDSLHPGLFRVLGKTRYKKQVNSFVGSIQITSLKDYYEQGHLRTQGEETFIQDTTKAGNGDILNAKAYSALAAFQFSGQSPAAFLLSGRAMLDFWLTDKGKVGGMYAPCEGCVDAQAPSKGGALLLQGTWRNAGATQARSFAVCRDVFFIANDLIKDFGIGDRGGEVNPKYTKLGWATYWENDEWWATSPKPSLSL
jgi:hypothetical protein